jgi:hypothetical protein
MLSYLGKRATGELKTGAKFIRDIVHAHPKYNKDSVINNEIVYDIVRIVAKIGGHNYCWPTSLLGERPPFMDEVMSQI